MCPIIQETAIALNDRAARRLGLGQGGRRAGHQGLQARRAGYGKAGYQEAGYQEAGFQEAVHQEAGYKEVGYQDAGYQEAGYQKPPHPWAEARSSAWVPVESSVPWRGEEAPRQARAGQEQRRPRRGRPTLLQRLLRPITRAAGWLH